MAGESLMILTIRLERVAKTRPSAEPLIQFELKESLMSIIEGIKHGIPIGMTEATTSVGIKLLIEYFKSRIQGSSKSDSGSIDTITHGIEKHLIEVDNWSSQIQFLGLSSPKSLDSYTIGLNLHTEPRRFRGSKTDNKLKNEEELLSSPDHYLVLGGPGSGKTTTLKRLCRKMLLEPPKTTADEFQVPIVLRLRELPRGASIFTSIADILGMKYVQKEVEKTLKSKDVKKTSEHGQDFTSAYSVKHIETRIGNHLIEDVIATLLKELKVVLVLDGLDEIRAEHVESIRNEIVVLARKLTDSKIILSMRSGEYNAIFEGFSTQELCPLTKDQIIAISKRWLDNSDDFMRCLNSMPYYDLADRPLLLTQLLFIFRRYGYLPEQPSTIYKKVVRLLLEEWDAQRDFTRLSKYAGFDPSRKEDFLAALSYHLTYQLQEKRFTEESLVKAYMSIYQSFNLTKQESLAVIREIETHSGILIASPDETYEFSHLSLQEYFCASYLVRSPMTLDSSYLVSVNVTPLAVAVVLASTPAWYFAQMIIKPNNLAKFTNRSMHAFLTRLAVEKPFFEVSEPLAFSIFYLYGIYNEDMDIQNKLNEIARIGTVCESLAGGLRWYIIRKPTKQSAYLDLSIKIGLENVYTVELPSYGKIPKTLFPHVYKLCATRPEYVDARGKIRELTENKIPSLIS